MQTIALRTKIPYNRKISLTLPMTVPVGEIDLLVVVAENSQEKQPLTGTGKQIKQSKLFGLWKHRTDIPDSLLYAKKLRKSAEERHDSH
jgi:hypothetical protein